MGTGQGRRRSAVVLTVMVALIVGAFALVANAGASLSSHLVTVERAALIPSGATSLGAPAANASQTGYVVLKPSDPAALSTYLTAIDNRKSSTYHQYLAAGQFATKFGPTQATIQSVKSQLTRDGLTVSGVSSNGLLVTFSGTTSGVESTFSTTLARYKTAEGVTGEEATSAVQLPSSISSDVTAVVGLNTLVHPHAELIHPPKSAYAGRAAAKTATIASYPAGSPQPCAAATADASDFGGLTDDQIANAYGAFGEYGADDTGAGVNVGVYELEPFAQSDLTTFDSCYFPKDSSLGTVTQKMVDGGPGTGSGSGEAILDVEDVSGMAPEANIDVYEAPNTSAGAIDEYAEMVDDDTDKIITSSWGECEQDLQQYEPGVQQAEAYLFEQAAAQGQTVLSAAGDTGDDDCDAVRSVPPPTDQNPLSVDDPSSQPYVLAVGGTTLNDADPTNINESVWNDGGEFGGGGGGLSSTWAAPSWQQAVPGFPAAGSPDYTAANSVEANAENLGVSDQAWPTGFCANNANLDPSGNPITCRALPDVSAQADEFTGAVTVYQASQGGWYTIGGTSSATPIWAGLLALVDASPTCQADGVTAAKGLGFITPLLYGVAGNATEYADSFHDITSGSNDVYGFDNGAVFPAGKGYDLASGLGSPILTNPNAATPGLAANLCALAGTTSTAPSISALTPVSGPVTGGGTLTISGSGFAPSGVTVSGVTIGSDRIPASAVTLNAAASPQTLTLTLPAGSTALANQSSPTTDAGNGTEFTTAGATGTQDGAGPADIVVTLSNGQSSKLGLTSQFSYVDGTNGTTPSVSSVGPYAGLESNPAATTVYGSGFACTAGTYPCSASGSTDTVTVGGVSATIDSILSTHEMKVTPPNFSSTNTHCVTAGALSTLTGDTDPAADDICQTNVVVTNGTGASNTDDPLPTYEGPSLETDQDGVPEVPTGEEIAPQPTEYDYYPTPTISSVSTDPTQPVSLADADPAAGTPGTIIDVTGQGLNIQTLNWFLVGDPTLASSEDYQILYYSGTEAVVELPADPNLTSAAPGPEPDVVPFAVFTVAATSAPGTTVTYAGIPTISSVSTGKKDVGYSVGPDAGGSSETVAGKGFSDIVGPLQFIGDDNLLYGADFADATQYSYTVSSDTALTTTTPQSNPGILDTTLCTESGCSVPMSTDEVLEYPPGNPQITGIDVSSGPAEGGSLVTITGENLGCVTSVKFGSAAAAEFENAPELLDCGSTTSVEVVAPAGTLGSSVPITLTTVEGDVQATPVTATSPTGFTYTANPTFTVPSFGSVNIGSSETETATVTNPGTTPVALGSEDADGNAIVAEVIGADAAEFTITTTGDQCSGISLAAGQSCTITVEFTPTASGAQTATLDLPFNDSPTDLQASLTGTGQVPTNTVTATTTTPGPTTTVTTPGPTVTTPGATVTTPGTTVTTPGRTTTVTVTQYYVCLGTPYNVYKTVKVRVRVRVKVKINGKYKYAYKYEYKYEKKKTGTAYHYTCKLVAAADAPKNASPTKAGAEAKARVVARAKAAAAAKARTARKS